MKRLVCIASHPDDEVLSAGAFLLKARDAGCRVNLLWATRGQASSSSQGASRWDEASEVGRRLRARVVGLGLEDGKLEARVLIPVLERHLRQVRPHLVVWPHGYGAEQHQDHRAVHEALTNVAKRWGYAQCAWMVGQPCVYSDSSFTPNLFLGYGEALMDGVRELMAVYRSERRKPFAKAAFLERRAETWAHEGQTGTPFAEPFFLLKGNPPGELFQALAVYFFVDSDDEPVVEYLDSLDLQQQALAYNLINELRTPGTDLAEPYSEAVSSDIRNLSVADATGRRINVLYFVESPDRFVLLHGCTTQSRTIPPADLQVAEARRIRWVGTQPNA